MSAAASPPSSRAGEALGLAGASFLTLYFELLFIRWLPAAVHILGYFTNLVLIAAFLGMGVGVARKREGPGTAARAFWGIVALVLASAAFHQSGPELVLPNEEFFLQPTFAPLTGWDAAKSSILLYGTIAVLFLATALVFLPLGQMVGQRLVGLPTLRAYGTNIAGSLLGILGFTALSALGAPPSLWVGVGLAGLALLTPSRGRYVALALAVGLAVQGAESAEARRHDAQVVWSPYYNVRIHPGTPPGSGYTVRVNNQFLLSATDLRPGSLAPPYLRTYYGFPYHFVKPRRVLVLGAGAGNDCHAALLQGAEHVTAVEIDPAVARIGREMHPAKPLADPRVRLVVNDARSFLRTDREHYDAVIFGTLDSHRLFSRMSSLRMENFIYTVECFRDALARLSPDGVMIVCVGPMGPWVHARIVRTLEAAAGSEGIVYYHGDNLGVVIGPGAAPRDGIPGWFRRERRELESTWVRHPGNELVATDDWPNVFARERTIPREYLVVLTTVLLLSVAFVRRAVPGASMTWELFFLGAGFLLVETKSITELGLLFGVTWVVSSIVIGTILVVIYAATMLRIAVPLRRRLLYPLLAAGLLAGFAFPLWSLPVSSLAARAALALLLLGIPVFLAALVFADAFDGAPDVRAAFASNMLGAVAGGVLEYGSLVLGTRYLALGAVLAYALAYAAARRTRAL